MKAVVLVVPAEQAETVANLLAATLSMNGWEHNGPSVIDWPIAEPGAVSTSPDSATHSDSGRIRKVAYDNGVTVWPESAL